MEVQIRQSKCIYVCIEYMSLKIVSLSWLYPTSVMILKINWHVTYSKILFEKKPDLWIDEFYILL